MVLYCQGSQICTSQKEHCLAPSSPYCAKVSGFILLVFAYIKNKGTWKDIGYNYDFTIISFWAQELSLLMQMGSAYLDRDLTLITTSCEHISLGFAKSSWKADKNMLSWEPSDLVFLFSSRNWKWKTNKNIYLNIMGRLHNYILHFKKKQY